MRHRSFGRVVFLSIALFLLFAAYPLTKTQLTTLRGGFGSEGVVLENQDQEPSFISNGLLVKLKGHARANLKLVGEDVNPANTGLPSLDVIDREHGVKGFHSIVTAGPHRDASASINSWYKLTLAGPELRLTLIQQSNDDTLNLTYSGAEPLGRLIKRLKQDPNIESVTLDYVMQAMFV